MSTGMLLSASSDLCMDLCSFPINKFHKKNILRNYHTYIMMYASDEGICVELWRKNNTTLVYLLSILFLDDFSIWLLGYRTEFSCLYIPQGRNFISTVWLWSTDECVFVYVERKSIVKVQGVNIWSVFNKTLGKQSFILVLLFKQFCFSKYDVIWQHTLFGINCQ